MKANNIDLSWKPFFELEQNKAYFNDLMIKVDDEYNNHNFKCFPPKELIFNAFNSCAFEDLKVVVIGQDPYHGEGEANGLCFSVNDGVKIPPSLKNIFAEINHEYNLPLSPISGNLERWAKQGVLLLNASLTVRENLANSHKHLKWNVFTDAVIQYISEHSENVVFLLWGNFAHKKGAKIDVNKHLILKNGHPSPLSYNKGYWKREEMHFKRTNEYLKSVGKKEIDW